METTEKEQAGVETHAFQAEIKQLLDIVINSLYTNKEIFVRELVSNAADALEKVRHQFLVNPELPGKDDELKISIELDEEKNLFTIKDNGIGMTRDELSENLGTIAHSGTKQFMSKALEAAKEGNASPNLIGQFGVGFYSAFMGADRVVVETKSFHQDSKGWKWESEGTGEYTISPSESAERGTKITLHLKEEAKEFAKDATVKDVIKRFSSFVPFPVDVAGEKANTIDAIWTRSKSDIKEEEYTEFYRFIANAFDEPQYRLHFSADAPLSIKALLFVPQTNMESMGFGKMEPGVDLYCRKVLIEKHPENLLPEWLRFARGVIDSDDIPLNISRESMQDSALIRKIGRVITNRLLKFFGEEAKKDAEKYQKFYDTFGRFLKEGAITDFEHRDALAKLLRFETSKTEKGKTISLQEYIDRMVDGQKDIYYINGASRAAIEAGPYVEALQARDYEVIYTYDQIDDFVFDNLKTFEEKEIKSADRGDLDLPEIDKSEEALEDSVAEELCGWIKSHLGDKVGSVRVSKRLVKNPAAVVTDGHMTASMQRLLHQTNQNAESFSGAGLTLEVNPSHPLIIQLNNLKGDQEDFAKSLVDQLMDNALLGAGLLFDPRAMVDRLNQLLTKAAGK